MKLRLLVGIGLVSALCASAAYGEGTVVDYKQFMASRVKKIRKKEKCVSYLADEKRKGPLGTAQAIPFNKYIPEYVSPSQFLEDDFNGRADYDYLFASSNPPLSKYDWGTWSRTPDLRSNSIFVLKVSKLKEERSFWSIQDLRSRVRLHSYTRISVSQYFKVFRQVIDHVRALESFVQSVVYEAAHTNDYEAFSLKGSRQQLHGYVSSWKTVSNHEEAIKHFLEEFLAHRYRYPEDRSDLDRFYTQLEYELLKYYSPEHVKSVVLALTGSGD